MDELARVGQGGSTVTGAQSREQEAAVSPVMLRTQPWTQLALLAAAVGVVATAHAFGADMLTPSALTGVGLIAVGALVMVILSRIRPREHTVWVAVVPLSGLVGIPLIRNEASELVDGIGFMMVFPLVWLGAAFPLATIAMGIVLAGAIPLAPAISAGRVPDAAPEWIAFGVFVAFAALIALSAFVTAHQLRREVSHRHAALAASREASDAQERLSAIFQAVSEATEDAVIVFDPHGRVLTANGSAHRLAKRAGVDLEGSSFSRGRWVYSADRRTPLLLSRDAIAELARRPGIRARIAWLGERDQVAVNYSAHPISHDDEPLGFVLIAHDVTDLVEAIEVRDRFLDSVSHELRTPLTVLMGETELAQMEDVSERVASRLDRVDQAAQRLFSTVEHLLSAYRTTVRALPQTTSVALTVGDVVEREASLARERDVRVRFADHGVGTASVDPRSLAAILDELLRNAVLYSPPGATVSIDARRDQDRPVVEITDAGVGMSETERRRAFDRFYRTDFAREQALPGVGLGLSIAQSLAEGNDISIELEPAPRGGTRARVWLPPAMRSDEEAA